jgi:hypothetical protein
MKEQDLKVLNYRVFPMYVVVELVAHASDGGLGLEVVIYEDWETEGVISLDLNVNLREDS